MRVAFPGDTVPAVTMQTSSIPLAFTSPSVFALTEPPRSSDLEREGRVRYVVVSGPRDDELWAAVGAIWLSEDRLRGGVLVNPWATWEGAELARGYRGALRRRWTPEQVFAYWASERWRGSYSVEEEQSAETLALLAELVNAL